MSPEQQLEHPLESAFRDWQSERIRLASEFAAALKEWLNQYLGSMPPDWRQTLQELFDEWSLRGVKVTDASKLMDLLSNRERAVEKTAAQQIATNEPADTAPTSDALDMTAEERAAFGQSIDRFFESANERREEELATQAKAQAALEKREYILGILGSDLQNVRRSAVNRLRREGLIAEERAPGGFFALQRTVIIELPRADGGIDILVLEFEWPWTSSPRWRQGRSGSGKTAAAVAAQIDRADDARYAAVMRLHGAIIQAQMAATEILASGGSWPLILQGLDQFQTAGRNFFGDRPHDSAITSMAAEFYEKRDMNPDQAKQAALRFEELLPLIAGLGGAGLNKIRARLERLPVGRGVWDEEGPTTRGFILEKRQGGNLPFGFKTIDKFADGVATSIKTLDLETPTYLQPQAITRKCKGYVDKLVEFSGHKRGGMDIEASQITGKVLEIIVPQKATPAQTGALHEIIEYGAARGVTVKIIKVAR